MQILRPDDREDQHGGGDATQRGEHAAESPTRRRRASRARSAAAPKLTAPPRPRSSRFPKRSGARIASKPGMTLKAAR